MKTICLCAAFFYSLSVYSQDTIQIKRIDSLVNLINISDYSIQRDTIRKDYPDMGFSTRTYLTMVTTGTELKKYMNENHATRQKNGVSEEVKGNNTFYFDHNKLIKVEEFTTKDGKKIDAQWYYADEKPIYYTLKSEKSQERAELLLTIAKGMLQKIEFK